MTGSVQPHGDDQWPFVGRVDMVAQLEQLLFDSGTSVLLAGPAGTGKTRLATELLDRARGHGFATIHITATRAAAEIPFGAFAGTLFTDDEPLPMPISQRAEWMRSAVRRLAAMGGQHPVVVLVDDIHLVDPVSATFIHHAVGVKACLLVATMRTSDPLPGPVLSLYKGRLRHQGRHRRARRW